MIRNVVHAAALQALKKRKLYESQLESVENNIMRVNEQQMMLENQRTTVETVSALSNAAKASKQTMHEMKARHFFPLRRVAQESRHKLTFAHAAIERAADG